MFFQPPDEEQQSCSKTLKYNNRSRRKRKLRRKNKLKRLKQKAKKLDQIATKQEAPRTPVPIAPVTMSAWAENFTSHATWKLKHEVAFWKSKAIALEHENKILHEAIRQNCVDKVDSPESSESGSEDDLQEAPPAEQPSDEDLEASDEFEVSEEFEQFLRANAVYREAARLERERLKAQYEGGERKLIEEMEAAPTENKDNYQETYENLYGDAWERISALDMSLQIQFISISDRDKPPCWPNIPFNFNYGSTD